MRLPAPLPVEETLEAGGNGYARHPNDRREYHFQLTGTFPSPITRLPHPEYCFLGLATVTFPIPLNWAAKRAAAMNARW